VCTGTDINLSATDGGTPDAVSFSWTGPNDFTSTAQNPVIANATGSNAGEYVLITTSNDRGCISNPVSINVPVVTVPSVAIINNDGNIYCSDGSSSIDLSVTDVSNIGNYNYTWLLDGVAIDPAENGLTYQVTIPGAYSVQIASTDGNSCTKESAEETIQLVAPPVTSFTSADSRCVDSEMTFTRTSTGTNGFTLIHNWDFGDGTNGTGPTVVHTYTSENVYTVTLNTVYTLVNPDNCIYTNVTKDITVAAPPTGEELDLIRSQNNDPLDFNMCPSGFVRLQLVSDSYDPVFWRLASEEYEIIDAAPNNEDTYRLDDEDILFATVTDLIGCTYDTNPVTVQNYPGSGVTITSEDPIIDDPDVGKTIEMSEGQISVSLSVAGVTNPLWSPAHIFTDNTLLLVEAFPTQDEQQIILNATDSQGCAESDSITLVSPPLRVDKNFSPNGDNRNDCWEISNLRGNSCEVTIFDSKGRIIRQLSTSSEDLNTSPCVWDGTRDGSSNLPDGVYYYVLKCTGANQQNKGGSILLAR